MTTFAGFEFPRQVPEFFKSQYNKRTLASGREVKARMRFVYSTNPTVGANEMGFYLGSDFAPGLRWDWCDEVDGVRIDHTGWFCDEFEDNKIRGVVFRLPHGRGFLAGWSMGESMASGVDYAIHDDVRDAAYAADGIAEHRADCEREYQASQQDEEETDDEA
jgi:hypothetical protein